MSYTELLIKQALKDEEPGIPNMQAFATIPSITNQLILSCIQKHDADKAGLHHDLRLVLNGTTATSWAVVKLWPFKSGDKNLAVRQPEHSTSYMPFHGQIPEGRGKGTVELMFYGKVYLKSASPNQIKFTIPNGLYKGDYLLVQRTGYDWLLINVSISQDRGIGKLVQFNKPDYASVKPEMVQKYIQSAQHIFQPKIDGAHNLILLNAGQQPRIVSHRLSSRTNDVIDHTNKIQDITGAPTPNTIKNTALRAEVYGVRDNKVIPSSELSGLLNSNLDAALAKLKERNVALKARAFDVIKYQGEDTKHLPYVERYKILQEIRRKMPAINIMPTAVTEEEKNKLLTRIRKGLHEETQEGVIAWPKEHGDPIKVKLVNDYDVYIREIYKGDPNTKYENAAGGFWYSMTPTGPLVGKVGTGFNDDERYDMWRNESKWVGKVATVSSLEQLPSGALRAPAFLRLHIDKNLE